MTATGFMLVRTVERLRKCRNGAVALETAIVLLPMLLIVLMTLESALIFAYQANFYAAVNRAARMIRTGGELADEQKPANSSLSALTVFTNNLCSNTVLPQCNATSSRLQIIVTYGTPSAPPTSQAVQYTNPTGLTGSSYQTGASNPCNLVLVQVYYLWPILIPLNGIYLKNTSSTWTGAASYLMSDSVLLQNENAAGSAAQCPAI